MSGRETADNELGVFLRARRSELSPSDVGLPESGAQRRVAGLRREEVAQLAAISIDYYTRLEQGRMQPSAPVLASLARVLRLTDDQRAYMNELAGTPARSRRRTPQKAKPYLRRILDHLDTPAIVMTPTHDILAWNPLAAALMLEFAEVPERDRNFVRLLFTDPRMRSLYPEWEELARSVVSYLRMEAARKPDDPRLAELVGDLSIQRRPIPPMVGRHPRRHKTTRHPPLHTPPRRRNHTRMGLPHLRRRTRPTTRHLHRPTRLPLRAGASRASPAQRIAAGGHGDQAPSPDHREGVGTLVPPSRARACARERMVGVRDGRPTREDRESA